MIFDIISVASRVLTEEKIRRSAMKCEYEAYSLSTNKPDSFDEYFKDYFIEQERKREHREKIQIAEAGRARNFWGN